MAAFGRHPKMGAATALIFGSLFVKSRKKIGVYMVPDLAETIFCQFLLFGHVIWESPKPSKYNFLAISFGAPKGTRRIYVVCYILLVPLGTPKIEMAKKLYFDGFGPSQHDMPKLWANKNQEMVKKWPQQDLGSKECRKICQETVNKFLFDK